MSRYDKVITHVFQQQLKAQKGGEIFFERGDIEKALVETGETVRNIGDLIYTYRFRKDLHAALPKSIQALSGSKDLCWTISLRGHGKYAFRARKTPFIRPAIGKLTNYTDLTPPIIAKHSQNDEQALLAHVRYSRILDHFLHLECHSLQNHYRTHVKGIGQTEVDEIYIGVDGAGVEYIIPVQAKGGTDTISLMQIEQDYAVCQAKYPSLRARAVAVYFKDSTHLTLFEFKQLANGDAQLLREQSYHLV
jgi:hypothetical protein